MFNTQHIDIYISLFFPAPSRHKSVGSDTGYFSTNCSEGTSIFTSESSHRMHRKWIFLYTVLAFNINFDIHAVFVASSFDYLS